MQTHNRVARFLFRWMLSVGEESTAPFAYINSDGIEHDASGVRRVSVSYDQLNFTPVVRFFPFDQVVHFDAGIAAAVFIRQQTSYLRSNIQGFNGSVDTLPTHTTSSNIDDKKVRWAGIAGGGLNIEINHACSIDAAFHWRLQLDKPWAIFSSGYDGQSFGYTVEASLGLIYRMW